MARTRHGSDERSTLRWPSPMTGSTGSPRGTTCFALRAVSIVAHRRPSLRTPSQLPRAERAVVEGAGHQEKRVGQPVSRHVVCTSCTRCTRGGGRGTRSSHSSTPLASDWSSSMVPLRDVDHVVWPPSWPGAASAHAAHPPSVERAAQTMVFGHHALSEDLTCSRASHLAMN